MDEKLLLLAGILSYGPFILMLLLFVIGLLAKLGGDASLLKWLIDNTKAQEPIKRASKQH